jgi:hypothetical protein
LRDGLPAILSTLQLASARCAIAAYQMAHRNPALSRFVPGYHGRPVVTKILDRDGVDLTGEFFPNLSYEIDFVPGAAFKALGADRGVKATPIHS